MLPPPKPLTRVRAWTCVLVNQLATPGLGSLWCGRTFAGAGQLSLACAGFVLLVGWMYEYFHGVLLEQLEEPVPSGSYGWMAKWGAICFGAAWLWALITSISLLRQAKTEELNSQRKVPPRITNLPN